MVILRSSHKAGKTTPKAKPFKELLSRLGQRSQLVAPKYADSTKQLNGFVWGRWTQYVYSRGFIAFYLSSRAAANKTGPRFCQKVYDESSYFTSPDPIDVCKNHLHYEVVRSFLEWSCQISKFTSSASLFTYAKAWRMGVIQYTRSPVDPAVKMDMKNVRDHALVFVCLPTVH
jgi:hypothetical protein